MNARRAGARLLLPAVLAVALAAPARGQDEAGLAPIPPPEGYVTDAARVLPEPRRAQLEGFLEQLKRKTGVQFAVLTVRTTAPEEPSGYKTRVFKQWGIGDRERDDGLLLLVAMEQREIRFETGYGLEGTLPDGWQSRMTRDLMIPRFRAGEPAEGIVAGVLASAQRIAAEKGVTLEWDGKELRYDGTPRRRIPPWLILLAVFLLVFVILPAIAAGSRHRGRGFWDGGHWGGGFGGFGGGFGGGSFGGGGGSSFGGFGGGSSGGGGGGGKW
jgi:uncharacterized protein